MTPNIARPLRRLHAAPLTRALVVVVAAAAVLALQPLVVAAAPSDDVPQVGTLPRFPADSIATLGDRIKPSPSFISLKSIYGGTLIGIPQSRQLLQLYPTGGDGNGPTAVVVRDMDSPSLQITRSFDIPVPLKRAANGGSSGGDWLHALDGTKRLFVFAIRSAQNQSAWSVGEIDLQTFAQRQHPISLPFTTPVSATPGFLPAGMKYDPHENALLVLVGGVSGSAAGNHLTFVHRIDLKTGASTTRQLRSCNGPLAPTEAGTTTQYDSIVTPEHMFFTCQRIGNIGAVVKVARSELMNPLSDEDIVAGPAYLDSSYADASGGRLFLTTLSSEIWAYDVATSSFVGVLAANAAGVFSANTGFGVDSATGRLFFQSPQLGLGIAEGRFYPIPQARTFSDRKAEGQERIISDPKTNRIYVLTGWGNAKTSAYKIYDAGTAPVPPPPPDPDRNTADLAEQPGMTDSRYFAAGSGFGVRTILAKGLLAAPPAPAAGTLAPTADILSKNITSKCGFTDRELIVARVAKAEYDTGSTAAQAVGVEVDERTKLDLANPSRCDVSATNGGTGFTGIFSTDPIGKPARENERGVAWDREAASCSSSEGGESQTGTSKNEGASKGSVECPLPGGELRAEATGYLTGAVAVGRADAKTTIVREKNAVRSTVVAEAQDIDLAGVIQIGKVTSIAESRSNGRPSKAPMSTHRVVVQGVTIAGSTVCTNNCNLDEVLRLLNIAGAGRFEFRSKSGRDDVLLKGTPKGASTAVQKSTARQASDQALIGDATTEVVGLEMISYNDNQVFGRARQVFQFAGAASAATYNITVLPSGAGFDDDAGFDGGDVEDGFSAAGSDIDALLPSVDVLPSSVDTQNISGDSDSAGPVIRALRALARGLRMFFGNPRHALLLFTAWALFSLPPVLSRRRRLLTAARSE